MRNNGSDRRVVITGLGTVTALGHDIETFWSNIIAGQCGIDRIDCFLRTKMDVLVLNDWMVVR